MKKTAAIIILSAALPLLSCGRSLDTRGLSLDEMEELADVLYTEGSFHDASNLYIELMFTFPGASNTDLYIYRLGVSDARQRLWADAEFYLWRVVNEFPRSIWADDAQLMLAQTLWRQKRDFRKDLTPVLDAAVELEYFLAAFPGSGLTGEAIALQDSIHDYLSSRALFTGQFYARRDRFDAAILYLREALDDYGETSCRGEILITLGKVYTELGNAYSAKTFYQRALDECELTGDQIREAEEGLEALL
jgi:outer membrane protein assembly factor BamD